MINNQQNIDSGLDLLVKEGFKSLQNQRVAILANQASVDKNLKHIVSLALDHDVKIVKLFAPEHGFCGVLQDMEHVGEAFDIKLNIPIISLYGDNKESLKLKAEHLKDIDILLCDLQDIGSRYYTFHCTIAWAMAACEKSNTKLLIIDRPNPINAHDIEGNLVSPAQFSFVGAYPLPNRHGFSMGELVLYVRDVLQVTLDLEIKWMNNYKRKLYFDDYNLSFVPPSPNMPTLNSALVYPGTCLIEGTNLSEGRGTCMPFQLIGAPYINDAEDFKQRIHDYAANLEGFFLRPSSFKPQFQKHSNKNCNGIFIHITDRSKFKPLRLALSIIKAAMTYKEFDWRREPYEFETNRLAIDLLLGHQELRSMLEKSKNLNDIFDFYNKTEEEFYYRREKYLYY
jgi:uncharacterized protein YbbC (DUF1343 family)